MKARERESMEGKRAVGASIGLIIIHFMEILNFSKDYLLGVAEEKKEHAERAGSRSQKHIISIR
jgi:hypothetical protein